MLSFPRADLTLNDDEIHLWFAYPDEIQQADLLSAYERLMTPEEQAQWQRFRFAKHQHQYLITRALIRTTLSRYLDIKPQDWRFSRNDYGRPEIIATPDMLPLRFNLSHTDGLVIGGVVLKQAIGVDVENIKRPGADIEIADRFFSAQEVTDLYQVPESQRRERFFDYWTLKESYIKARGMGLSLPLEQFTFHISGNQPLRISFDLSWHDKPQHWQFWLLKPTPQHTVAVSLRRDTHQTYQLILKKVIPGLAEQTFHCSITHHS